MNRLLITGAAGNLGTVLRTGLADLADTLRLSDVAPLSPPGPNEEIVQADLADLDAVLAMIEGVDVIVHFGGISGEADWERILPSNIVGCYNVWEAARRHGVRRVIHASSNHAIGMYDRTERLGVDASHRPDTYYGLAKAFAEDLGRMYFDKYGIEAACLRIGSCFPEPRDERMLATWLSYPDLVQLVRRCIEAPKLGFAVVYGVSDNDRSWWDNSGAGFLGYRPQDNAERFASRFLPVADNDDPRHRYHGGHFSFMTPDAP